MIRSRTFRLHASRGCKPRRIHAASAVLSSLVFVVCVPAVASAPESMPGAATPPETAHATGGEHSKRLTLGKARALAYKNNLKVLLAHEKRKQQDAQSRQALSALLPHLSGVVSQSRQTVNLKAQGFDISGLPVPNRIGPFNSFDARARVVQKIFDLSAIRSYQAAEVQEEIAGLQQDLARRQVATGVTIDYVQALQSRESIEAAQANLKQARRLLQLAQNQRKAGLATNVDVARAKTSVAQRRTGLIQSRTRSKAADLRLKRAVGLPLKRRLVLTTHLSSDAPAPPPVQSALTAAFKHRVELRINRKIMTAAGYQSKSALDRFFPTLSASGAYGLSGETPYKSAETTYSYGLQLQVPLFSGGRNRALMDQAESRKRSAKLRLRDLRRQVKTDVRLALTKLHSARQGLKSAHATRSLSKKELQLARDRFAKGAADNIEVVNAQTSLADARNQVVSALAAYNQARVNLAAALGRAESFRLQ